VSSSSGVVKKLTNLEAFSSRRLKIESVAGLICASAQGMNLKAHDA
jgi:hypothetical protein